MSEQEIFIDARGVPFDPIEKAGLSPKQVARMEQLGIAVACLKDGNGLRIMFQMDYWIMAQLVASLFDAEGNPKSVEQQFEGSKLQ